MSGVELMAHMVAGYPGMGMSMTVAQALVAGSADYLEVQFPFSDPSSDGPLIERACQAAIEGGFRVDDGFEFMEALLRDFPSVPLFIMTYGSLVFAHGVGKFCDDAVKAGVRGLIIPDLPPDFSEGLFDEGRKRGLAIVPVIAPEISDARLKMIGDMKPEYIYTALRLGITGSDTRLDDAAIRYLDKVRKTGSKIIGGFGVRSREMMLALEGYADIAAVGSHFLKILDQTGDPATLTAAAKELKGIA
ncbi:MAG: tryptophan synthase subunit alpha [Planctomycetaceae bacterium]|nr:tryptophan synthase subunit alpha [Planctomycetaceae bacterium]